ncbi:MAG: phosphonate ABC transporter ATP-binding protein [Candidatus Acetothermia bacterium]|nr:phosphonate ABC transporter ATP-binding protein [Candidatus Bipolaricaulota bacterium]
MAQLEIKNLKKIYPPNVVALKDISFEVEKGEFLVVIGLSGSGKSTLLRCINRLIEPTEGSIKFEGREVTTASKKELREIREDIAMVFQRFNLIERSLVLTNVLTGQLAELPLWRSLLGRFPKELKNRAYERLETVGIPEQALKRADELSGGQQQRVGIARALMQDPKLLLADEPVSSLDPATSGTIMDYLAEINNQGKTVITSLHFLDLVRKYGTRAIGLKDGNIVYDGHPKDIDDEKFKEVFGEEAEKVHIT